MGQIYSAPTLSEVIRQLMIYRLTGVLMIRRAMGSRREEASLAIVQGQPGRVRWGMYEDSANESILKWMNGWGEIDSFALSSYNPQRTRTGFPCTMARLD